MSEKQKIINRSREILKEHTAFAINLPATNVETAIEDNLICTTSFLIMKIAELQLQVEKLQEDKK